MHALRLSVRALAKRPWLSRAMFLAVLLVALPILAHAQEATIVGTVTDPSGGVVPNVTITVTNLSTGFARTLTTNDSGQYGAPGLPIGKYDVKATGAGFREEVTSGVVLNVNDRIRIDFQLKMGTKSEVVSVESNPIAVQADSSEQSSLINGTQITELATNGRAIYSYVVLTPGASSLMSDSQLPVPVGSNSNISFNGNRPGHNLYLLDGGENSDRGGAGSSSVMPSIDAIAETQTLTSNYSADYGLSSAGTISSAIKSGTKTFHASAWEFFRNNALDARNYFNAAPSPVAELRYNIFGFNVGGPVTFGKLYNPEKTKTFFFYNMEWRRIIEGQTLNQTVPATATYGGDFANNLPANGKDPAGNIVPNSGLHVPCANQLSTSQQAAFGAAGITTFSTPNGSGACSIPSAKGVADPVFLAFPGNTIPAALLDPNAQALLHAGGKYGGIFPAPTSGSQFIGGNNLPTNVREEIVRIDENVTDKFTIFGHFVDESIAQTYGTTMWSGDNVPTISNTFGNPSYAAVVHTAYVINPNVINEASFNYNGNRIHILPLGLTTAPSNFTFNRFFTGPNELNRIPSIDLSGATGANFTANWTPWNNIADSYQLRDDVSWTKGRHQLKMGGGWLWYKKGQSWFKNTEGNFTFNGNFSGNDFADYLLGYAQNYTEDAIQTTGHWNNVSWAAYIQDNWRVTNRLTLNLGLRWDGIPHTYEANLQMNNFYPNLYNQANAAILNPDGNTISAASPGLGTSSNPILAGQQFYVNGIQTCGINVPQGCVNGGWFNLQPRIGFAYDLTGSGKTIIRGGYGLMNERIQGNDVYNNAGTVPLSASINFNNVLLSDPKTSIATGTTIPASIPVNNITGLNGNSYATPRSSQFSIGIQHSIGRSVLSASYVGTQNRGQNYYTETDLGPESLLPAYVSGTCTAVTAACPTGTGSPVPYNSVLPYLGYHSIRMSQDEANGDYNALQVSFRGQIAKNSLTYQLGYTYSHTNDSFNSSGSAGDLYNITNPYAGWKYDYGPSAFDRRNIFFANFVYDIPLFNNAQNHLLKTTLGGWEISGIVTASSGAPINIGLNGNSVSSIVPNSSNRPDQTGTGSNPNTVQEWFDTSIYAAPACTTAANCWGDTPRNSVRGPGRQNWNISLFKNFVFSQERGSNLQFRAEVFNIFNHPQWFADTLNGGISNNFGASNFGAITTAYDPRIIQLALKLYF